MSWLKNAAGLWLQGKKKRCKKCSDPRYRRELKRRGGFAGYPGCGCCQNCNIESDNFDRPDSSDLGDKWNEASGSWEILNNQLVCTSAGVVLCSTVHPDGDSTMVVEVDFQHDTNGRACDVIVGAVDASNYFYVRYTVNGASGSVAIRRNNGGIHSQISIRNSVTLNTNTTYTAEVCVSASGGITARLDNVVMRSTVSQPVVGTKFGLGCSSSGAATFDNIVVKKIFNADDAESCDRCNVFGCAQCVDSMSTFQVQLTVPEGILSDTGCSNCAQFEGVFILEQQGTGCNWQSPLLPISCPGLITHARWDLFIGSSLLQVKLVFYFSGTPSGLGYVAFNLSKSEPIDCIFDSLVVPFGENNSGFNCVSLTDAEVVLDAL